MSPFTLYSNKSAPGQAHPTLETVARTFGFVPNLPGVMADLPAFAEAPMVAGTRGMAHTTLA